MITVLLHSSKTMTVTPTVYPLTTPAFIDMATALRQYVTGLDVDSLRRAMHISETLAQNVKKLYLDSRSSAPSAAVESFRGDIYSGLRSLDWTDKQKMFAQKHLRLLSGLYGVLRPYDAVIPYRLEAGYRLPDEPYNNLYTYWADRILSEIKGDDILDLTSKEYGKLIAPYVNTQRIVTPIFLTRMAGGEPTFIAVHAKIARGAFARWIIKRGINSLEGIEAFDDLGYRYNPNRSTPEVPVYICDNFDGIGLSQRKVVS